jgi:GTP-binding protein
MIEPYLGARGNLVGLLIVMDIRRDWTQDEENLIEWMSPRGLPAALILTKADKMSRSQSLNRQRIIRQQSGIEFIFVTSSLNRTGFKEVEDFVYSEWVNPKDSEAMVEDEEGS